MRRSLLASISIAALAAPLTGVLATPASAASSHVVTMHATRQHLVTATTRTRPGWTRLKNTGSLSLLMYAPRGHAGPSALAKDLNSQPSPGLDKQFRLTTTIDPHASAYVLLQRGTYFVFDGDHVNTPYRTSQIATTHVSGSRVDTSLPKVNRIPISANLDPHAQRVLSAHTSYVSLVNAGTHVVDVISVPVDASTSTKTINAFLEHPSYERVGTLARNSYYALAQEAAPQQTIINDYYPAKGRWMIVTRAHLTNGRLQGKLHEGQAELVTLR